MPANRSRTENWKQMLHQVHQRGGGLEIAFKDSTNADGADIVFRVRLLQILDNELIVDTPAAVGRNLHVGPGVPVVGTMIIGQNRWMFSTRTAGQRSVRTAASSNTPALVLAMPVHVERCPRRQHFRVSTAALNLPTADCWPLMDPATVIAAETANRLSIEAASRAQRGQTSESDAQAALVLPEVGPKFTGRLLNISGGGLGLLVTPEHAAALQRQPFVWMLVDLRPQVSLPLALTARRVHTHLDAMQNVYAGFAFEFAFNPSHQQFVTDVLSRTVESLQREPGRAAA